MFLGTFFCWQWLRGVAGSRPQVLCFENSTSPLSGPKSGAAGELKEVKSQLQRSSEWTWLVGLFCFIERLGIFKFQTLLGWLYGQFKDLAEAVLESCECRDRSRMNSVRLGAARVDSRVPDQVLTDLN